MHAIVSNVRGPGEPLYLNGARLLELQSMGPLDRRRRAQLHGLELRRHPHVGIVACREHVPDIWTLADGITTELKELLEAAEKVSGR